MGAMQRRKGRTGEEEAVNTFKAEGVKATREWAAQCESKNGVDVRAYPFPEAPNQPIAIQVKYTKAPDPLRALQEAIDWKREGELPYAMTRLVSRRKPKGKYLGWAVTMRFEDFMRLLERGGLLRQEVVEDAHHAEEHDPPQADPAGQ